MRKTFIFILYFLVITALVYFLIYNHQVKLIQQEYKQELARIAELTSYLICSDSLEQLVLYHQSKINLSKQEILVRYNKIKDKLQLVQHLYPEYATYLYVYIFDGVNKVLFLIDADEDVSYFRTQYDVSAFPLMMKSLFTYQVLTEDEISYDQEFDTYSISAYAPLYDSNKNHIASLGLDSSAMNYNDKLKKQSLLIFSLSFTLVLLSLLFPISLTYLYEKWKGNKHIRYSKKIIKTRRKAMKQLKE